MFSKTQLRTVNLANNKIDISLHLKERGIRLVPYITSYSSPCDGISVVWEPLR